MSPSTPPPGYVQFVTTDESKRPGRDYKLPISRNYELSISFLLIEVHRRVARTTGTGRGMTWWSKTCPTWSTMSSPTLGRSLTSLATPW
jgi:hypothetical protein